MDEAKKGCRNDEGHEGSKTVVRIIALEQGIIKVVGLRHDWPVSPISVERVDERTTTPTIYIYIACKEFSQLSLFVRLDRYSRERGRIILTRPFISAHVF